MKESDHLVTLAQEFWETAVWLVTASELAECSEVRLWESSGFKECASDNVLVASDGSGGSRETPKSVREVAFGVTRGFWQTPDASDTQDGALFNKAQIIDSFSSDMEMQTWKTAARHSSSSGLEKGIITDLAKKARSQLIKEGSFTAARALDFLVCGAINEPHLPADGSVPNQFLSVRCDQKVLATRKRDL